MQISEVDDQLSPLELNILVRTSNLMGGQLLGPAYVVKVFRNDGWIDRAVSLQLSEVISL